MPPTDEELRQAWLAEQQAQQPTRRQVWRSRLFRARHLLRPVLLIAVVLGAATGIRALRAAELPNWPVVVLAAAVAGWLWLRALYRREALILGVIAVGYLLAVTCGA